MPLLHFISFLLKLFSYLKDPSVPSLDYKLAEGTEALFTFGLSYHQHGPSTSAKGLQRLELLFWLLVSPGPVIQPLQAFSPSITSPPFSSLVRDKDKGTQTWKYLTFQKKKFCNILIVAMVYNVSSSCLNFFNWECIFMCLTKTGAMSAIVSPCLRYSSL